MTNDFAAQYDDGIYLDREPDGQADKSKIIVADKLHERMHRLPEVWLRSRVRAWMHDESAGLAWWIGGYTDSGTWIWCSQKLDTYIPKQFRIDYARDVCAHLDRTINLGGAWLAGWARGGREFYLLWKDSDGDIKVIVECDKPFVVMKKYDMGHWERVCSQALVTAGEWDKQLELTSKQKPKLAQGQAIARPSPRVL